MEKDLQTEQTVSRTRETSLAHFRGALFAVSGLVAGFAFDKAVGVHLSENIRAWTWIAPMFASLTLLAGRVIIDKIKPQFENDITEMTVRNIYYILSHVDVALGTFAIGVMASQLKIPF